MADATTLKVTAQTTVLRVEPAITTSLKASGGATALNVTSQTTVLRTEPAPTRLLTVGVQGMRGADGAGTPYTQSLTITALPTTTFVLAFVPQANSLRVYLNGLREWDYTVTGTTVNFSGLNLGVGDRLTFDYTYGA